MQKIRNQTYDPIASIRYGLVFFALGGLCVISIWILRPATKTAIWRESASVASHVPPNRKEEDLPSPVPASTAQEQVEGHATITPKEQAKHDDPRPPEVVVSTIEPNTTVPNEDREALPPTPQPQVTQTIPSAPVDWEHINQSARSALVNILCTTSRGGSFRPITATGVVIGEQGIILTNAHVAQYLLLADYTNKGEIDCVVRAGNPAQPLYHARVLYISSHWIEENISNLTEENPLGTGEHDYALLEITQTADPNGTLPKSFPALPITPQASIFTKDPVMVAGYPAGFLGGITVQKDLYLSSTIVSIGELFTFGAGSIDLFSLGGSILAQKGVSGGAVVEADGQLLGIITTSLEAPTTDERDLRAISLPYITEAFRDESGISFMTLLEEPQVMQNQRAKFQTTEGPRLAKMLIDAVNENARKQP